MKTIWWLLVVALTIALGVLLARAAECEGPFLDPNTVMGTQDPGFLKDPTTQIRLYQRLRVGQKLNLTFTMCDPDGDPIAPPVAYLTPQDAAWSMNGAELTLRYTARSPIKRDVIAFVLTDAPEDPNTTPASRIAAIVIDVTKNNPPLWR